MCIYNQNAKVAARERLILEIKAHDTIPSLSWILALMLATASLLSTSSVTVFPVRVFTKICIFAKRRLELGHFACRKRRIRVFWTPGGETFWVVVYIGRGLQGLDAPATKPCPGAGRDDASSIVAGKFPGDREAYGQKPGLGFASSRPGP